MSPDKAGRVLRRLLRQLPAKHSNGLKERIDRWLGKLCRVPPQ